MRRERRDVLAVGALALAIRAVENFVVHPPMSEIRSDMAGYVQRAQALLDGRWGPEPRASFYPFGTHALIYGVEKVAGSHAGFAIGLVYALMGTAAVVLSMLAARRLAPSSLWVPRIVGGLLAIEPAWVSLGSFVLSETPTAVAISAMAWLTLRFFDEGRTRDAAWLGVVVAIGSTFRPQILASLALVVPVVVLRRPLREKVSRASIAALLAPIALVLAFSTARMHFHTGRYTPMPSNGPFNFVFGRCHCTALSASKTRGSRFEPPSLKALYVYKERHGLEPFPPLDPVLAPELSLDGELWDPEPAWALSRRCVAISGVPRQIGFAFTHLILLWGYNVPWPTDGWAAVIGNVAYTVALLPGLVVGLALSLRRDRSREALLTAILAGLFVTAALFFGEARMRAPYDGVVAALAIGAYRHLAEAWRARRRV